MKKKFIWHCLRLRLMKAQNCLRNALRLRRSRFEIQRTRRLKNFSFVTEHEIGVAKAPMPK